MYGRLASELENEGERRRAVETKLLSIVSVAPIAVSIMIAGTSFLSSGRLRDFAPVSVIAIICWGVVRGFAVLARPVGRHLRGDEKELRHANRIGDLIGGHRKPERVPTQGVSGPGTQDRAASRSDG